MDIFLSQRALQAHRDLLLPTAPADTRWVELHTDGQVSIGDDVVDIRSMTPEVAWMTTDLVQGGPARQFFGLVTRSTSLRWLQSSAAGFDHPVFGELLARGVRLTPSHVAGPPIADYVLRSALDHLQRADEWRVAATEHRWEPHEFTEMSSTRWCVIGLGTIGAEIALRAKACGAHVIGVRRHPTGSEPVDEMKRPEELHEAVAHADVVVLAAPATAATAHLVDADLLTAMEPGVLLINVGRGALIDEPALIDALDAGRVSRAVLDVVANEPLPSDDPLWAHPKVVITPHSSALGDGRHRRAARAFAENLARYVAGDPLVHEVGPDDLDA